MPRLAVVLLVLCGAAAAAACAADNQADTRSPDSSPGALFKPVSSEVARAAQARLVAVYQSSREEIVARAAGGNFRLAGENQYVPADLAYVSARIEALLDTSRPPAMRLDQGAQAVTALVAGYRTTEMPEFALSARDILGYVRAVLDEGASDGYLAGNFEAARLTPLEMELSALETACSCPR